MGLIYRAETNFQLKGAKPVKLPLLLTGQEQITCLVQCKQRKQSWSQAGLLEQVAFLSEASGMTTIKKFGLVFDENQLIDLIYRPNSFLIFSPKKWLIYRTNISIFEVNMPVYQDPINVSSSSVAASAIAVSITQVLILAANPARLGFSITNASTNRTLFLDFDGNAAVAEYGIRVPPNSIYEAPVNYTGDIHGIWNGTDAAGKAFVREFL